MRTIAVAYRISFKFSSISVRDMAHYSRMFHDFVIFGCPLRKLIYLALELPTFKTKLGVGIRSHEHSTQLSDGHLDMN